MMIFIVRRIPEIILGIQGVESRGPWIAERLTSVRHERHPRRRPTAGTGNAERPPRRAPFPRRSPPAAARPAGVEAGRRRQDHSPCTAQRQHVLQGPRGQRRFPDHHDQRPSLLQIHVRRTLEQVFRETQRDAGDGGCRGGHHEHAANRIAARRRPRSQIPGGPVPHARKPRIVRGPLQPFGQIGEPVPIPEGDPRLVQQSQPRRPAHHQVYALPRVEQRPDHGSGVRRPGSSRDPDDPRPAPRPLTRCAHAPIFPAHSREHESEPVTKATGPEERP
jgi:hypothetical protein